MELTVQISQEHSSTQVLSLVYGLFPSHPTLCPWHLWFSDLKLLRVSTFPFVKSKFWKFQISSKTNLEHFWLAIWALYKLIFDFGLMTYFENIKVLLISTLSECFPYWAFDHSCLEFMLDFVQSLVYFLNNSKYCWFQPSEMNIWPSDHSYH